ncbi:unnamed protein product [Rangifer tarandus platyrhynchus]|uniref:Uncharacterized protein n=2 Tax=Rangifer tarandus platyrhynchus TaxID=3082113 RepID=A0ABN8Y4C6_RANTA|nr:unnamed protein product [Rangifer tarandus platyrhynchus]CAI9693017.1 unnamed protein product [Rangifer tarandus platyrhynchus]
MSPLFSWVAKVPEILNSIQQARWEELHCLTEFDDILARKFEVLFWGHRLQSVLQPLGDAEQALSRRSSPSQSLGCGSLAFREEFQDAGLRSSSFFSSFEESDIQNHLISGLNIVEA